MAEISYPNLTVVEGYNENDLCRFIWKAFQSYLVLGGTLYTGFLLQYVCIVYVSDVNVLFNVPCLPKTPFSHLDTKSILQFHGFKNLSHSITSNKDGEGSR